MTARSIVSDIVRDAVRDVVRGVGGGSASATLAFHAAAGDGSDVFQAQLVGTGTPTFTTPAGYLVPDGDSGYYESLSSGDAPIYGARWDSGTPYVDDSGGTPLAEAPSLMSQPALTNLLLSSNDLTNAAWNISGSVTRTFDQTGLTGAANDATLLTSTGNGSQVGQTITLPTQNTSYVLVGRYKKTAQTAQMTVQALNFGVSATYRVDTNGTTVTNISTQEVRCDVDGDYVTMYMRFNPGTGTTGNIFSKFAVSGTSGESFIVLNMELYEADTIAQVRRCAPIVTGASTVTVPIVDGDYDDANHSDTEGLYYFEFALASDSADLSGDIGILSLNAGADLAYFDATNDDFESTDGTNTATASQAITADTFYPVSIAYGGGKLRVRVNGTWGTEQSYDGAFASGSALEIMRSIGSAGRIRNLRRYNASYADAVTQAETLDP